MNQDRRGEPGRSTYISLINDTQEGIPAVKDSPKRLSVVKRLAKKMGGKVKHFYLTIGDYDLVVIYEMPDETTMAKFLLTVAALGDTLAEARAKAYRNVQRIHFSRRHYRRDIAAPAQEARVQ